MSKSTVLRLEFSTIYDDEKRQYGLRSREFFEDNVGSVCGCKDDSAEPTAMDKYLVKTVKNLCIGVFGDVSFDFLPFKSEEVEATNLLLNAFGLLIEIEDQKSTDCQIKVFCQQITLFYRRFLSFIRESGHKGVIIRIRIKEEDSVILDHDEKSCNAEKIHTINEGIGGKKDVLFIRDEDGKFIASYDKNEYNISEGWGNAAGELFVRDKQGNLIASYKIANNERRKVGTA